MAKIKPKETFATDYKTLDDDALLEHPPGGPLSPLTLFVCTYVATLSNLKIDFRELTRRICEIEADMPLPLVAFNSNFGHRCRPGYEEYLKAPKVPNLRVPLRGRPRKVQGDGTSFNSAIEPILIINHPGVHSEKVYKVKCFPTTGATQVPGVICPDLSDGSVVLSVFVDYLNSLGIGTPDAEGIPATIAVSEEGPKMINYKFRVIRSTPRMLIDLRALSIYMDTLESSRIVWDPDIGDPAIFEPTEAQSDLFRDWPSLVPPPFIIRETKPPTDDVKMSFRFTGKDRFPRVNVFQEGKINILGADTFMAAEKIYHYFEQLFAANWPALVCLQPRRDNERRELAPALREPPAPAPTALNALSELERALAEIADEDIDALITEYCA
jgi:hypothetical protein